MPFLEMADSSEIEEIKRLGQNVTKLRKDKGLSLEMLSNIADIDLSGLHRIETGKTDPKVSTLFKIARALDIDVKELF
jgi:transcriptional regulator with XRE-family HTH domain